MIAPADIPTKPAEDILLFCRETWETVEVDTGRYSDFRSAFKSYRNALRRLQEQGSAGNIEVRVRDGHVYLTKPGEACWGDEEPSESPAEAEPRGERALLESLQEVRKLRMDVAERLPDAGPVTHRKLRALDAALARDEQRILDRLRELGADVEA